jgi:hypothetical protein
LTEPEQTFYKRTDVLSKEPSLAVTGIEEDRMVAATSAPARTKHRPPEAPRPSILFGGAPATVSLPRARHARPIAVAAYPAGVPRWVTYSGRRQRVVAVHEQQALAPDLVAMPPGSLRMEVELADGRVLTLLHDHGAWYHRGS